MENIVVYSHAGSTNHGCEALLRMTNKLLPETPHIFSISGDDYLYGANNIAPYDALKHFKKYSFRHFILKVLSLIDKNKMVYTKYWYKDVAKELKNNPPKVAVAIGGDAYCYGNNAVLFSQNIMFNDLGARTVLWGCSIEPELLNDECLIQDLNRYAVIIAREHITESALLSSEVTSKIVYCPDPAFGLPAISVKLPHGFENVVGINISPLIQEHEKSDGITFTNYLFLIDTLLEKTDFKIALIPHVVTAGGSDLDILKQIYVRYNNNNRVFLIDEQAKMNCMELKYIISKCRFFVAARTHASIAAYSSGVPTLVIGYSVKAKGIAQDLFGTYSAYVISASELREKDDIYNSFMNIVKNENGIKKLYEDILPKISSLLALYTREVERLLDEGAK